jgi:hypothetical protein
MVAHACNTIYLGGRDRQGHRGQSMQKIQKTPILTDQSQVCWYVPIIPAIGEA